MPVPSARSTDCSDRPIARAVPDLPHPPAKTMRIDQHLAMTVSTASIAAILLIATVGGLAIESRPVLTATIRSAARHHHDPAFHPMPGPSASSDLLADANGTVLAFASICSFHRRCRRHSCH